MDFIISFSLVFHGLSHLKLLSTFGNIHSIISSDKGDQSLCVLFIVPMSFISLLCILRGCSDCLIRISVGRNCQRGRGLIFSYISHKSIGPFVFCLYVFVMLNVIESTPTCLHWSDLIVLHLWVLKEGSE